jgi:hypothetical protein
MVIDLFPLDSEGDFLSQSSTIPSLRMLSWVMDELYHSLDIHWNRDDAAKGLKFAIGYVKCERKRQIRVMSSNPYETSINKEELRCKLLAWQEGPYVKAWAASVRERPRH